jgi:hypothetical protein
MYHIVKEWNSRNASDKFLAAMRYASSTSAIVVQAFFAAAQIHGVYPGEQRDGNALVSGREFRLAHDGVWRWVYATRAVNPGRKQEMLSAVLRSIERSAGNVKAKEIRTLALRIAGCICMLVRLTPGSSDVLSTKGITVVPGANYYCFAEVHPLGIPVPVTYLRNPFTGRPKWATRYLTFGVHCAVSITEELYKKAIHQKFPEKVPLKHQQCEHLCVRVYVCCLGTFLFFFFFFFFFFKSEQHQGT